MKDFHYGKLTDDIKPVALTYLTPDMFIRQDKKDGLLNVRLNTTDPIATMKKIQAAWKIVHSVSSIRWRVL